MGDAQEVPSGRADSWKLFDELAATYETVLPYFTEFAEQLVQFGDLPPGAKVLDVGAGPGIVGHAVVQRGGSYTGVDPSEAMVRRIRHDLPDSRAVVMAGDELSFPPASFDVVTSAFVLHTVDSPDRVVGEAHRVLRDGGLLLVSVPAGPAEPGPWQELMGVLDEMLPRVERPKPDTSLEHLLDRSGFVGVRSTHTSVALPCPSVDVAWDWLMSHGFAGRLYGASRDRAAEVRNAWFERAREVHAKEGLVVRGGALLVTGRKPAFRVDSGTER